MEELVFDERTNRLSHHAVTLFKKIKTVFHEIGQDGNGALDHDGLMKGEAKVYACLLIVMDVESRRAR